jgi:pseudouridine-5'-phosphate glycosidase
VSACYSQSAGAAFVEAGVPHVVAIRTADQVTDAAAMRFADSFYDAIFVGGYTGTVHE